MLGAEMQGEARAPVARGPGHLPWILSGLAALALWLLLRSSGPCDDEYIVWRYARSLSQGHGLCFTLYSPVEGFTCPLWLVVLAGGMMFSVPPLYLVSAGALAGALGASWAALIARGRVRRESDAWCALAIALSV